MMYCDIKEAVGTHGGVEESSDVACKWDVQGSSSSRATCGDTRGFSPVPRKSLLFQYSNSYLASSTFIFYVKRFVLELSLV